jgi:hypothetical protein
MQEGMIKDADVDPVFLGFMKQLETELSIPIISTSRPSSASGRRTRPTRGSQHAAHVEHPEIEGEPGNEVRTGRVREPARPRNVGDRGAFFVSLRRPDPPMGSPKKKKGPVQPPPADLPPTWFLYAYPVIAICSADELRVFDSATQVSISGSEIILNERGVTATLLSTASPDDLNHLFQLKPSQYALGYIDSCIIGKDLLPQGYLTSEFLVRSAFRPEFLVCFAHMEKYEYEEFFETWMMAADCRFEIIMERIIGDEYRTVGDPESFFMKQSFAVKICKAIFSGERRLVVVAQLITRDGSDTPVASLANELMKVPMSKLAKIVFFEVHKQGIVKFKNEQKAMHCALMALLNAVLIPSAGGEAACHRDILKLREFNSVAMTEDPRDALFVAMRLVVRYPFEPLKTTWEIHHLEACQKLYEMFKSRLNEVRLAVQKVEPFQLPDDLVT